MKCSTIDRGETVVQSGYDKRAIMWLFLRRLNILWLIFVLFLHTVDQIPTSFQREFLYKIFLENSKFDDERSFLKYDDKKTHFLSCDFYKI